MQSVATARQDFLEMADVHDAVGAPVNTGRAFDGTFAIHGRSAACVRNSDAKPIDARRNFGEHTVAATT